ncbi:MAG TPA: galactokinase family protein [Gemmatimonadaceae bacterium]|nr:galactokinase family protein [Gemmatimonadaceae bacterium]
MSDEYINLLIGAGMAPAAAQAKGPRFAEAAAALRARGASPEGAGALFTPGRVEVLGKHTDYAGGRSLLCAVERGVCMLVAPRADGTVRVIDARVNEEAAFAFDPDVEPPVGHWSNYPMTVARRLARNFADARTGADIAFSSDLPVAAGVSSSSALVVAVYLALASVNPFERGDVFRREITDRESLASYLGCVENGESFGTLAGDRGVGVFGGSEDQTAILCCRPRMLSQYSYTPVRAEGAVPMPAGHVFVIADSGVVAEKAGAARDAYNRASVATRVITRLWNDATGRADGTLAAVLESGPGAADRVRAVLRGAEHAEYPAQVLVDRFDQFADESTRIIPAAHAALAAGDTARFGALVDESQGNVERWLGNQIAETIALQRQARALGAVAASAFGAGFGGSVWAMVPAAGAEEFARRWLAAYRGAFPGAGPSAQTFLTGAGPAAVMLANPHV